MSAGARRKSRVASPGMAEAAGRIFVDIFTRRPISKLLALALASVLVYLIHRELSGPLWEKPLSVVATRSGASAAGSTPNEPLIVQLPPEYRMVVGEGEVPPVANLVVTGLRKDAGQLKPPFRATLPAARLSAVNDAANRVATVSLEAGDIELPQIAGASAKMPPVPLRIARLETAEAQLRLGEIALDNGLTVRSSFTPSSIKVLGIQDALRRGPQGEVSVTLGGRELLGELRNAGDAALVDVSARVREVLSQRRLEVVEPMPAIQLSLELSRPLDLDLEVLNLPILIAQPVPCPYEFVLEPPYDRGVMPQVVLQGSERAVQEHKKDPKKLESELAVIVLGQRAIEKFLAAGEVSSDPEGVKVEARAFIPEASLRRFDLRMKDNQLRLPIRVKRRN